MAKTDGGLSNTARNILRWLHELYPDGQVRIIEHIFAAVIWVQVIDESFKGMPVVERDDFLFELLRKVSNHHRDISAIYGVHNLLTQVELDGVKAILSGVRKIVGGDDPEVCQSLQQALDVLQFERESHCANGDTDTIPATARTESARVDIAASVLDSLQANMRMLPAPDAVSKCRDIGRDLHAVGGLPLMRAAWYRMNELNRETAKWLEFAWDGVGNWVA